MASGDWSKPLFITGTTLSAFLSGSILSISAVTIPSLLSTPNNTTLLTTWSALFKRGAMLAPPMALLASLCHAGNAYIHRNIGLSPNTSSGILSSLPRRSWLFILAATSVLSIVPYTGIAMMSTNKELMARDEKSKNALEKGEEGMADYLGGAGEQNETTDLVRKWGLLNAGRSLLPLLGAFFAWEAL